MKNLFILLIAGAFLWVPVSVEAQLVKNRVGVDQNKLFLTLDACVDGYDSELLELLEKQRIPAVIFVSGNWLKSNPQLAKQLSENPLFTLGNHGYHHRPLTVDAPVVYGIRGTGSPEEARQEVVKNQQLITRLTGAEPEFFRAGTGYYDDTGVAIVYQQDLIPVNFTVTPDFGGTASETVIVEQLLTARPGDIILLHMHLPATPIASGLRRALPELRQRQFEFGRLLDYLDKLTN